MCRELEGPIITDETIRADLTARIAQVGPVKWSKENGFSRTHIGYVLAGQRGISKRIAETLGYRKVAKWEKI